MPRVNHLIVLMQENRSFDHMFGFATPPAGQTIHNLAALSTLPKNMLDPSKPVSSGNPSFSVSQPAPFAVHDKDGPSHSFNAVNTQLAGDFRDPRRTTRRPTTASSSPTLRVSAATLATCRRTSSPK